RVRLHLFSFEDWRSEERERVLTLDRVYTGLQLTQHLLQHMQSPAELPVPMELPAQVDSEVQVESEVQANNTL
ncbi:MAG: hypothetical protein ACK56I_12665, partial [bacterium]